MSNDYLQRILAEQTLSSAELDGLRNLRAKIESQLAALSGGPRFYYGGSFGKRTMIRARYDMDLVVYWPHTSTTTIRDLYNSVGNTLKRHWKYVNSKTVA
jgi:hypothetical protein